MSDAQAPNETRLTDDQLAGMSDEEFASMDLSFLSQETPEVPEAGAQDEPEETPSDDPEDAEPAADGGGNDDAATAADDEPADDAEPTDGGNAADAPDDADPADGAEADGEAAEAEEPSGDDEPEADDPEGEDKPEDKPDEVDYKAEYERILKPFKANGRDIQVDSVDDAISLMQMGANYNKKMASLKPNLKMLKLLENNDLLSEDKLGYLVDLHSKNPEAIKKLVQESGIDPLEMDLEKKSDYTPSDHKVDDREIELDSVLDKIQDTPTYQKTVQLVQDQWDGESKRAVAESPQLLEVINDHMNSGVYDIISTELEKQRMLGRLNGLSDIAAYKQIGDNLNAKGGFDHLFQEQPSEPAEPKKVPPKPKAKPDPKVKSKKRAASSTRTAPSAQPAGDLNPLTLSDDEFEKLVNEKYV